MVAEESKISQEEILKQLPDNVRPRRFSSVPVEGYTSTWQNEPQSLGQQIWDKTKKNPFIPIGLAGTVYFLTRGVLNMGNGPVSQKMMRGRVLAQAFTLTALVVGFLIEGLNEEKKETLKKIEK